MDEHEIDTPQPAKLTRQGFSPTFVCELSDGRKIRMSVFCSGVGKQMRPEHYAKGLRLVAEVLRTAPRFQADEPTPKQWWFEADGEVIGKILGAELEATPAPGRKARKGLPKAVPSPGDQDAPAGETAASKPPEDPGKLFGGDVPCS
jgi:hypothetical protein